MSKTVRMATPRYAFCEPSGAGAMSREHLRRLMPDEPLKLGGMSEGITLCGRDLRGGWDLQTPVTLDILRSHGEPRPIDGQVWLCPTCYRAAAEGLAG